MDFKDQILKAIENEVRIIKHIYTKLPEGSNSYRPAENMRSVDELLDYLSWCGPYSLAVYLGGNPAPGFPEKLREYQERARSFGNTKFAEKMDDQLQEIRLLLAQVSDDDLKTKDVKVIWGETMKLGDAILNTVLKYFVAYRMQLFLYAKMAGASQLSTANCWMGMDPPQK